MKVETAALAIEIMDALVPDSPTRNAQKRAQLSSIDRCVPMNAPFAKHREEVAVLQRAQCGKLQFKQRSLVRIQINAIDAFGFAQGIVKSVATGACNHDDPVPGFDLQRLLVDDGIFPTLVV